MLQIHIPLSNCTKLKTEEFFSTDLFFINSNLKNFSGVKKSVINTRLDHLQNFPLAFKFKACKDITDTEIEEFLKLKPEPIILS